MPNNTIYLWLQTATPQHLIALKYLIRTPQTPASTQRKTHRPVWRTNRALERIREKVSDGGRAHTGIHLKKPAWFKMQKQHILKQLGAYYMFAFTQKPIYFPLIVCRAIRFPSTLKWERAWVSGAFNASDVQAFQRCFRITNNSLRMKKSPSLRLCIRLYFRY